VGKPKQIAYTAFDGTEIEASALNIVIQKKKAVSANELARLAAPKGAQILYNALHIGPRLILRSAFQLLRANMATRVISVVVLLVIDKFSLFRGRISFKQFLINVVLALMLLVGGTAGWMLGSHAFSLIMENLILGILAGIIGAGVLSAGLSFIVNKIIHLFTTDDTEDMLAIYTQAFTVLANEHKLNHDEITAVKDSLNMCKQFVQDLFVEEDKITTANAMLEPHVQEQYEIRNTKDTRKPLIQSKG